jgi:hypothetical protein
MARVGPQRQKKESERKIRNRFYNDSDTNWVAGMIEQMKTDELK